MGTPLPNDLINYIGHFIQVEDVKGMLCYMNVCKFASECIKHRLCEWILGDLPLMPPEHEGVVNPSLLTKINRIISISATSGKIQHYLTHWASHTEEMSRERVVQVILLIHLALYGTACLYQRHDQIAGFSPYNLFKLEDSYQFAPHYASIGECYYFDKLTNTYTPLIEYPGLKCNGRMKYMNESYQIDKIITRGVFNEYRIVNNDIYLHDIQSIPPKPQFPLVSVIFNGNPLFLEPMKRYRFKIWIYQGKPSLFKGAIFLHQKRLIIENHILCELNPVNIK